METPSDNRLAVEILKWTGVDTTRYEQTNTRHTNKSLVQDLLDNSKMRPSRQNVVHDIALSNGYCRQIPLEIDFRICPPFVLHKSDASCKPESQTVVPRWRSNR